MVKIVTWLLPLMLILSGCATVRTGPSEADTGTPTLNQPEMTTQLPEGQRFVISPETSELRIVLQADGALARLGHPHVIGGGVIEGVLVIAERWQDSVFQLWLPVDALLVDVPEWREEEGFNPHLEESAIEATRGNMLSEGQLNAANHPFLSVESLNVTGPQWQPDIDVLITVAGQSSEWTIPVALDWDSHQLRATGQIRVKLSELGIEPFSALGGRLRVADDIVVRFTVHALAEGTDQSIGE